MTAIENARAVVADPYSVSHRETIKALARLIAEHERLTAPPTVREDPDFVMPFTEGEWADATGLTAPPTDDELNDLAYLITAKRFRERGLRGAIGSPDLEVARPLAEFLLAEGYRRHGPIADEWEYGYELIEQDTRDVLTRGWPYDTQEEATRRAAIRAEEESDPDGLPLIGRAIRRRVAGPWGTVEAAREAS